MSSPNLIPKRTTSPFARDSTRLKELQKQTQRFLLANQQSNQYISNQLCQKTTPKDNQYNNSLIMSPRGKIPTQQKRTQTLTSFKRDISPDSLRNHKKNTNNNLSYSPDIYSLAHIPFDQQDTITKENNKINNNNNINTNSDSIPLNEGLNNYEETPKFKFHKSENIISFLNKQIGTPEKQGTNKESSCASCFSFNHDISNDEDTISAPENSNNNNNNSNAQQSRTFVNSMIESTNSELQNNKSQYLNKKHVSFCPEIIANHLPAAAAATSLGGKEQDSNLHQIIQIKSCLGENKNLHHKSQNKSINLFHKQYIELPQTILTQPVFASFAPQEEYSQKSNNLQQEQLVEHQPEETNKPMNDFQKSALFQPLLLRQSLENNLVEGNIIEEAPKTDGQSKLSLLREKLVKPQDNSSIAKYIKASSIKKASSQEFIEIPSQLTENSSQKRDERIPFLLHQLKSNLSGDHCQKKNEETIKDQIGIDEDKNQSKYQFEQESKTQTDLNIIKEIPLQESPRIQEIFQTQAKTHGENNEKAQTQTFSMNNFESQAIQRKFNETALPAAAIPDEFTKKESTEGLRDIRNDKADSQQSIPSWQQFKIDSQDIQITSSNIENNSFLQRQSSNPQYKAAVVSLNLTPNCITDTSSQQKPISIQNSASKKHNPQKSCVIHLEPYISEFKNSQTNSNNKISEEPLDSIRTETIRRSQQSDIPLDFKINQDQITNNYQKLSEKPDQPSRNNNSVLSSNQANIVNKQSFLTLHSANSSNINNTTMASSTETLTSVHISETPTSSSQIPQSQEYFTTSFLKPSPMPIINCQFTNHLHKKTSVTINSFNNTKQDACSSSSPAASYLALPKKLDKNYTSNSTRLDSSMDFSSQNNLALNKNVTSVTRPQPAIQPSPAKTYSSFIRQSFTQTLNRNFNRSQENIIEDYQPSKKDPISSSSSSKSSSLVRSSSPSKVKSNPYEILPQKIKPSTKLLTDYKSDFGLKKNSTSSNNSNQVYSIKTGYKTTQSIKDSQNKTPNRDNSSNKTTSGGFQYLAPTKTDQEFSNYQLSQSNLEREQIPSRRFNSQVQLPQNFY